MDNLIELHLIFLGFTLSLVFDINSVRISNTFITIGVSITPTHWRPIERARCRWSCSNASSHKSAMFSTRTAAAVVKFAKLIIAAELGRVDPTLASLDIEVKLIFLRFTLSLVFDINSVRISSTFITIGVPITPTHWGPIHRARCGWSCSNTSARKSAIFSTWTATAVIEFAKLIIVTEIGGANPTLTSPDVASRLLRRTSCST